MKNTNLEDKKSLLSLKNHFKGKKRPQKLNFISISLFLSFFFVFNNKQSHKLCVIIHIGKCINSI